ncbi:MAG TPA: winged helix-turn-helix domain-containing protein [Candidatus Acidoferrales bacterium]|nr:winged helix-turn-helix domain-containing protein [Candidatus Acidoferrales bacterium]
MPEPNSRTTQGFGSFEVDFRGRVLRKHGIRIRLSGQPFEILALLMNRPGEIVTREELRAKLWPADTFVDFDHGLNAAINKLREALGDSAEKPRFIETAPRVGYRFVAPLNGHTAQLVEENRPAGAQPVSVEPTSGTVSTNGFLGSRRRLALLTAVATFVVTALVSFWWLSPPPLPKVIRSVRITHSGRVESWGRVVRDGQRLYFLEREGNRWNLAQTSAEGGEAELLPAPFPETRIMDISPDRSELLLASFVARDSEMPLWTMSVAGGLPRRVGDITARDAVWAPDGQGILYVKGSDLYMVDSDGSQAHRFLHTNGVPERMVWSPDRQRLRFTLWNATKVSCAIWEVRADGTDFHPLIAGWSNPPTEFGGLWTPDGRYFLFSSLRGSKVSNIWAIRESRGLFHGHPRPVQLTNGPMDFVNNGAVSQDGKRLFVIGSSPEWELMLHTPNSGKNLPLLPQFRPWEASYSPRGDAIAYAATSPDALWRIGADGTGRMQLTFSSKSPHDLRWSPDEKQIAFWATETGQPPRIYVISAQGGPVRRVAPAMSDSERPDWSPDGGSLVFDVSQIAGSPANALYVADLKTGAVSKVPGSKNLGFARWSPAGNTVAALTDDQKTLMLYDFQTRKWTTVAHGILLNCPVWSPDGKDIYFQDLLADGEPIFRLSLGDGKRERVPGCEKLLGPRAFRCGFMGFDPNGLLVLQLLRTWSDIYALDLDLP